MLGLLNLYGEMFDELKWSNTSRWFEDKGDHYELSVTMAGTKKEEVKVSTKGSSLLVENKKVSISVSLPGDAAIDDIKAKLDLGLLVVSIGKKEQRIIEIE